VEGVIKGMLVSIDISNYQSHKRTRIPFGRFTVITGPSNAGKSSVIRAAALVVRNAPGTGYIRRGAGSCAVILAGQDPDTGASWAVGIERTARGGGRYRLRLGSGGPQEYTKLGGQVPEAAARVLRLGPLNFAGQHDGLYLLGRPGTEVARTMGDLTNVSMLFRAAAEAGRVRKQADRDVKGAEARLGSLRRQAEAFDGLDARLAAVERAEAAAAQVAQFGKDLTRLRDLISRAEIAADAAEQVRAAAAAFEPPDLTQIERGLAQYRRLCDLMCGLNQATVDVEHWAAEATMAAEAEQRAHQALHDKLVAAGQCPLCGQGVAA
jgi:DNA repair ATPase RecN